MVCGLRFKDKFDWEHVCGQEYASDCIADEVVFDVYECPSCSHNLKQVSKNV